MPPKKEAKKDKKDAETPEEKMAAELRQLEGEKFDLGIEVTFLKGKLQQAREECDSRVSEGDALKLRMAKASQDYTHILAHREGQIKTNEARLGALVAQNEALTATVAERDATVAALSATVAEQGERLTDAASVLEDKERLEAQVIKQIEMINRQTEELENARAVLAQREAALAAATERNVELAMRASVTKEHRIMFDDPWIVETTHHRCKGEAPLDREGQMLLSLPGKLVLVGGQGRSEAMGRDVWCLDLATMHWQQPPSAQQHWSTIQASCTHLGRTKMLVQGGYRNDEITAACSVLNTDQWKWFQPRTRGEQTAPSPRTGHCLVAIRESIFLFGGLTEAGLSSELWVLDLDSLTWAQVPTFGVVPSPRKGASAVASENGRKIYLFGGHDGSGRTLADVHVLEMERFSWQAIGMLGAAPEGREGAAVSLLGSFMIVVGGAALLEGGARKPLTDMWVAHLVKAMWEPIGEGGAPAGAVGVSPLKAGSVYSVVHDERILTLRPDRDELLGELQVTALSLPEHLDRLRAAKKKEAFVNVLELCESPLAGPTSLEVSWRPPTKNADQIERYKLMLASSPGGVREVASGAMLKHHVGGLRPRTEYIFCVKAIYQDGSFLWSDSKAFRTTAR